MSTGKFATFFLIVTCTMSGAAFCEQFNQRNLLPGSRAAAMGGAFTALSDDASAGWYNPAGLGFVQGSDISLSANAFTKSRRSVKEALGEHDVAESSTSLYPAFAGSTSTAGPFHLGYSYFTVDRENSDESYVYEVPEAGSTSAFKYTRRQLIVGEKILAGASVALPMGKYLSIGVSEFYYRRSLQTSLVESTVSATGATFDANLRQNSLNEGSVTVIGILLRGEQFSIGLGTKIPKALADNTTIETAGTTYVGSTPDRTSGISKPHEYDEVTPREYSLGIAWQPATWFVLSTDALHYPGEKSIHRGEGGVDTKATTNYSAGGELFFGSLGIRGGGFTNNSLVSVPDASQTTGTQPGHIDYVGWTTGLSFKSKSSETSVGVVRQTGTGHEQTVSGNPKVYEIDAESTSYVLSSRYSL